MSALEIESRLKRRRRENKQMPTDVHAARTPGPRPFTGVDATNHRCRIGADLFRTGLLQPSYLLPSLPKNNNNNATHHRAIPRSAVCTRSRG